jgi:Uma2 family endonuclease
MARQSFLLGELVFLLASYSRSHGGESGPMGDIWFEGRGWRCPDLLYRAPDKPEGDDERSLPATLVIEILGYKQPLDGPLGLRATCIDMCAEGVDVCWIIDPQRRSAEIVEPGKPAQIVTQDGVLESPLMPGFSVSLPNLWAALDR